MQSGGGYNYGPGNGQGPERGGQWVPDQSQERMSSPMAQGGYGMPQQGPGQAQPQRVSSPPMQQQRASSPLPNVSSGYVQRTNAPAAGDALSPTMGQAPPASMMGTGNGMPPLNLNTQVSRDQLASPPNGDGSYAANQYGYNSPQTMNYNPYNNPSQNQYNDSVPTGPMYGMGELKQRGAAPQNSSMWTAEDFANGHSSPRRMYSPQVQRGYQAYENGYQDYGYSGYGGYGGPPKKNRLMTFLTTGNMRFLLLLLIPSVFLLFTVLSGGSKKVQLYPKSGKFELTIGDKDLDKLGDGTSVVAACMGKQDRISKVLENWLEIEDADEIILVDWSSDPPLKEIVDKVTAKTGTDKIKLIRVDDEEKWVLSRAFNVGMQFAAYKKIIRTDCDYAISKNFTEHHDIEEGKNFFSGDWRQARNENEIHLNGIMHVIQKDFWRVSGYDERIQTYGWDDEDMYGRLENGAELEKGAVNYDTIVHLQHDDSQRAQEGVEFVEVETDYNRIMLEKLPQWSPEITERSEYQVEADGNFYDLKAKVKPRSVAELTDEDGRKEAWDLAIGSRLHDQFRVPWDFISRMDIENKERLLRNLMAKYVKDEPIPRILFGHCMHGLGNRLRALASMLSFAKNTNKELFIIWENDEHCGARFDELFADPFVQMDNFGIGYPFSTEFDDAYGEIDAYNYMELEEGANKGEIINDDPEKHTYYKGAYIMECASEDLCGWTQDNELLRELTPVPEVQAILDQQKGNDLKGMVGVHIRNRDLSTDIQNVDFSNEYTKEAGDTMDYWRHKSHYKNFIDRMRQLLAEDPNLKFYVASDTFEIQAEMEKEFEGKIFTTQRTCDDRDASCVRYALADLYNLGHTQKMLGSNWSSFTEAAQRLGGIEAELAGLNFAVDPEGPPAGR